MSTSHDHNDHHDSGAPHASLRGYVTGFVLSVVLTAIPFALVMTHALSSPFATGALVIGAAFVQIIVHMIYFLHMDGRAEGGWTLMALIFTVILLVIALSGSLWVMYHLNSNMVPGMMTGAMGS